MTNQELEAEFIASIVAEEEAEKMTTHNQSAHNLGMIVGYIVEQTIKNGERFAEPLTRHRLEGANKYGEALELCRSYRSGYSPAGKTRVRLSWAVVRAIYSDGCISEPF